MKNVLGIFSKKRGGKSSSANYFAGRLMVKNNIIERFDVDDNGNLLVNTDKGEMGIFDLNRKDPVFAAYCSEVIWPTVRFYNFADELKIICMNLYGLTGEQCYGSTEQKESLSKLTWNDFKFFLKKNQLPEGKDWTDYLSSRDVLNTVSDILKKAKNTCWCDNIIEQVKNNYSDFSIIADVRFDYEVEAIKAIGGKVIALTRSVGDDKHVSELGLDGVDNSLFDAIIDNKEMTLQEKNTELDRILQGWGWL